jgi:hypothetical protein
MDLCLVSRSTIHKGKTCGTLTTTVDLVNNRLEGNAISTIEAWDRRDDHHALSWTNRYEFQPGGQRPVFAPVYAVVDVCPGRRTGRTSCFPRGRRRCSQSAACPISCLGVA